MFRTIVAVFALAVGFSASAADTFSQDTTVPTYQATVAKIAWDSGTETMPAAASPETKGLSLLGLQGFSIHAEAAAAMTAGGKLLAYVYNPVTGRWNPAPEMDLVVANLQYQFFTGWSVAADVGRIAYVPSGVGQAVTVYIVGSPRRR